MGRLFEGGGGPGAFTEREALHGDDAVVERPVPRLWQTGMLGLSCTLKSPDSLFSKST